MHRILLLLCLVFTSCYSPRYLFMDNKDRAKYHLDRALELDSTTYRIDMVPMRVTVGIPPQPVQFSATIAGDRWCIDSTKSRIKIDQQGLKGELNFSVDEETGELNIDFQGELTPADSLDLDLKVPQKTIPVRENRFGENFFYWTGITAWLLLLAFVVARVVKKYTFF